jgi:hypothetical protein
MEPQSKKRKERKDNFRGKMGWKAGKAAKEKLRWRPQTWEVPRQVLSYLWLDFTLFIRV